MSEGPAATQLPPSKFWGWSWDHQLGLHPSSEHWNGVTKMMSLGLETFVLSVSDIYKRLKRLLAFSITGSPMIVIR